jgi:hypothetical protein
MFTTLQNAEHFILTALGKAEDYYGGPKRKAKGQLPLAGSRQGNGAAATLYAILSSIFIAILAKLGSGAVFITALSGLVIRIVCSVFEDESDIWQSAKNVDEPGEAVAKRMQGSEDNWEGCLMASGGALSPAKSFWYLIDYIWDNAHRGYK